MAVPSGDSKPPDINIPQHLIECAKNSIKILARNDNYTQLSFLESLHIKRENPPLNKGIKATKELQLFK